MQSQVAFVHWRERVVAHARMAVDAVDATCSSREKVAKQNVALQMRRCHNNWDIWIPENLTPDLEGASDAAVIWRAVEGRTDLVLANPSSEPSQTLENRRQILGHPLWIAAAAFSSDANGGVIDKLV